MRVRVLLVLLLTSGPAMTEAAVLKAMGFVAALGLSPAATAPVPYGIFHDMRWVFVYHASWGAFAGEMTGMVAVRSLLDTAIIALVWPREKTRPLVRTLYAQNLIFTAAAVVVLSPWVCVSIAASGTSLSWFILGELLPVAILAMVLSRGRLTPDWWSGLPPLRAAGWSLAAFVSLTVGALIVGLAPGWWAVPVAGIAGAANAGLWWRLARAVLLARRPRVPALAAPLAVVITVGAVLSMSVLVGFGSGGKGTGQEDPFRSPASGRGRAVVLYVGGYESSYDGSSPIVTSPGLIYEQFSYRGLDRRHLPRAYGPSATYQSLSRSARLLAAQVRALYGRTGHPVAIVAESEGTLVARTYIDRYPHRRVDALVFLSPLVRPGRVYLPPAGAQGWGVVAGWELRAMFMLVRLAGGPQVSPDQPFVRSLLDHAPEYRNGMMCPVPGIRSVAFLPFASAAVVPPGPLSDIPVVEVTGFHGSLSSREGIRRDIIGFLGGGRAPASRAAGYRLARYAAVAWETPALGLAVNPAWHYPAGAPDASFGGPICTGRGQR